MFCPHNFRFFDCLYSSRNFNEINYARTIQFAFSKNLFQKQFGSVVYFGRENKISPENFRVEAHRIGDTVDFLLGFFNLRGLAGAFLPMPPKVSARAGRRKIKGRRKIASASVVLRKISSAETITRVFFATCATNNALFNAAGTLTVT